MNEIGWFICGVLIAIDIVVRIVELRITNAARKAMILAQSAVDSIKDTEADTDERLHRTTLTLSREIDARRASEHEVWRLNMEMAAYRQNVTPADAKAMLAVIDALEAEKRARHPLELSRHAAAESATGSTEHSAPERSIP